MTHRVCHGHTAWVPIPQKHPVAGCAGVWHTGIERCRQHPVLHRPRRRPSLPARRLHQGSAYTAPRPPICRLPPPSPCLRWSHGLGAHPSITSIPSRAVWGCGTQAQGGTGHCIAHGGGHRCQHDGCTQSVRTQRRVLPSAASLRPHRACDGHTAWVPIPQSQASRRGLWGVAHRL